MPGSGIVCQAVPNNILTQMYEITLEALKDANNQRLWFNTNIKIAKVYLASSDFPRVESTIQLLKESCQKNGRDDPTKGTSLLEVYALEIQLCTASKNSARMKQIFLGDSSKTPFTSAAAGRDNKYSRSL